MRNRMTLLFPIALMLWSATPLLAETSATSTLFAQAQSSLEDRIVTEGVSAAWVRSASTLERWSEYPDFLELAQRTVEPAYAAHRSQELAEEIEKRLPLVQGSADWGLSFDTGILAMAAGRYVAAVTCFSEALLDPEKRNDPFTMAYLGRSFLRLHSSEVGRLVYQQAIQSSSADPAVHFQINFMFAMDLYENNQVPFAVGERGPIANSLRSEYPLEKCFALYESLLHAWGEGDEASIDTLLPVLEATIAEASPSAASAFEQRRYSQAAELLHRMQAAGNNDDLAHMILDEEACDFDFKTNHHALAASRLQPWVQEFPLTLYAGQDQEMKDGMTWVHLNCHIAEVLSGSPTVAEAGFLDFLRRIPFTDFPRKVVEAWLWLGYTKNQLGDLSGAQEAYEMGLSLDASGSPSAASEESNLSADNLQPRILAGKTRYQVREAFVKQYHDLLLTLHAEGE